MYRAVRTIMFVLAITFAAQMSAALETVGEVTKVSGGAKLERSGQELDIVATMPVAIGDQLRTAPDGQVWVGFRDGSKAELGESSSFTIDRYALSGTTRVSAVLKLWRGHLRSIVMVITGAARPFEVHTPNSVASVRGTEFETAFIEGRPCPEDRSCMRYTTVGVSKGIVEVSNPSNPAPPVEVHAGYETTIPCESAPTSPAPLGVQELGAPGYH